LRGGHTSPLLDSEIFNKFGPASVAEVYHA
jgi:hypothetical protein